MNPDRSNNAARARHGWAATFAGLLLAVSGVATAQTSVTNRAGVTPPTGVISTGTACATAGGTFDAASLTCTAESTITVNAAPTVDFCPASGPMPVYSLTNGVLIHRFVPGGTREVVSDLTQTISGTLNGLMIDPIKNRLLFHDGSSGIWAYDAGNGGWYQAATQAGSFPRGGMGRNGVGYLIQGGTETPAVYRVTADAVGYGYTVTSLGNLTYSHPTEGGNNSGDIAFDADGIAWISTGFDLYRIDFSQPGAPVAVRQTRPVMPGGATTPAWAGVAFDSTGNLVMTALNGTSYSYDFGSGNLTSTTRATPSGTDSRDLASCAFPQQLEPDLGVVKTLALVNGAAAGGTPVVPGDVLTYDIAIANTGGAVATLYPGDVVETLPAGTTAVAAGNDFTCTGTNCPNTAAVNVPAGGNATLHFVVQVSSPIPAGQTDIANAVTVKDVDCAVAGNDCAETTPIGPFVSVQKTGPATVAANASFDYTLTVSNTGGAATGATVVVQDQLPAGVVATAATGNICGGLPSAAGALLTCNVPGPVAAGGTASFTLTVTAPAVAGDITNYAATSPGGSGNPGTPPGPGCTSNATTSCDDATTTVQSASLELTKTAVLAADQSTITYSFSVHNTGSVVLTNVNVTDLLLPSLSCTAIGSLAVGATESITCTNNVYAVLPADRTAGQVVNNATATGSPPAGADVTDGDTTTTPLSPLAGYNFCPADGSFFNIVNGAGIYRFAPPGGPGVQVPELGVTLGGNVNALLVDPNPSGNRLLFHHRGNGAVWAYDPTHPTSPGWYETGAVINADLPRGGMTQTGVGYFMTSVSGPTTAPVAQMYRIERSSAYGYTVSGPMTISYDVNPSDRGSGDIAFDGDGNGWLVAGNSLYKVDVAAGTATLQLGFTGAPSASYAGAAFGGDGRLYVVVNATGNYYAMDLAAGTISLVGHSGTTGGDGGRDLASCSFPAFTPPQLQVVKTLAEVNGSPATAGQAVQPGDVLRYGIEIRHVGGSRGATLFPGDVIETLPAGTTAVAAGNDFTCTGTNCPNTAAVNVPAGGNATLHFVVQVSNPIPAGQTDIANAVTVKDVDCAVAGNDCVETTPIGPFVSVQKTGPATVAANASFDYTLTVSNTGGAATGATVVVQDQLPAGVVATAATGNICGGLPSAAGALLTCNVPGPVAAGGTASFTLTVTAPAVAGDITNYAATSPGGSGNPGTPPGPGCTSNATTSCDDATTQVLLDPSVSVTKSADPVDGQAVIAGQTLTYTLSVVVTNAATLSDVVLTDALGTGLTFVGLGTVNDGFTLGGTGNTRTFTLPAGATAGTYEVSYTATVDATATTSVGNAVSASGGGDPTDPTPTPPTCTTCSTTHPLTDPSVSVTKSADPVDGQAVVAGQTLTYTLSVVVANAATLSDVVLTDALGAGLTFVGLGTVNDGFTLGGTGNTRTFTLPAGATAGTYEVSYTATVDATATTSVGNAVSASGGGDPTDPTPTPPTCTTCSTTHPLTDPSVSVTKSADPVDGQAVVAGQTLTYTLSVVVANAATLSDVVLTDALGAGLTFVGLGTVNDGFTLGGTGNTRTFTLPAGATAGTYEVSYTATVDATATTSVGNAVSASGGGDPTDPTPTPPTCTTCVTTHPLTDPSVTYSKSAQLPTILPEVSVGDTIAYTLTVVVANSQTTDAVVLTDTLGTGLTFGAVTVPGIFVADTSGSPLRFTLPANTTPGTYAVTYTAQVNALASVSVANAVLGSGGDNPTCASAGGCGTVTPLTQHPSLELTKSALLSADQATITYGFSVRNTGDVQLVNVTVADPLLPGLSCATIPILAVGASADFTCTGNVYAVQPADVDAGQVANTATASGLPPAGLPVTDTDTATVPLAKAPALTLAKSVTSTGPYRLGSTIAYAFVVTNSGNTALDNVSVTDPLPGLSAIDCPATTLSVGASMTCTATYVVTAADVAAGNVHNRATAEGTPPGEPPVVSPPGETDTPIQGPGLTIVKTVTSTGPYGVGSTIAYRFVATNTGNVKLTGVGVADALPGLSAISYAWPGAAGELEPGQSVTATATYVVTQADVDAGRVHNSATAEGTPPGEPPVVTPPGEVESSIAQNPAIAVSKQAVLTTDNGTAGVGNAGDVITYTVRVTNTGNTTLSGITVLDSFQGGTAVALTCAPTTLAPGQVAVCDTYTHVITQQEVDAGRPLENTVLASGQSGVGGTITVTGDAHALVELQPDPYAIRIAKAVAVREVRIGDLVRYTLTVENVGNRALVNGSVVDTPPAGFTYVEGSLDAVDGDNAATVSGQHPLRFDGVDVAVGQSATLTYLMRVGAGVRPGSHQNQAQAYDSEGKPVSNIATAEVELVADSLLDDSLIFGTVFDDRDGDGWQDAAGLTGVRVQGGFAPGAYVPGSTTVDRGQGHQPQADASSPLLHGIAIGAIGGRQSAVDPAERQQVVVRQRLSELAFTSDFVLGNDQGVTVRMDAAGNTTVEKSGDAAKGLNAAEPSVERRVAVVEGGYVVDYVIRNLGFEERGIPGVRIASVEGLLMETDQFGRYHLAGVDGGNWARGRNFILKVDPSTLPAGTEFTTDNPLLRRVTPGLPVRFDWGVKLPVAPLEGRQQAELELGEVIFAPGSAEVRAQYLAAIDAIAAKIAQYRGGEVVIQANGHTDAIALARAEAVKALLLPRLPAEVASALAVSVRADAGDPDSMVVGVDEGGYVLGLVLFDTDRSAIRTEFGPLLDRVAQKLEQRGEGVVTLVGHTDVRGSHAHNTALGLRRAKAVQEALTERLSPEVRARVRVDVSNDPTAPVGMKR